MRPIEEPEVVARFEEVMKIVADSLQAISRSFHELRNSFEALRNALPQKPKEGASPREVTDLDLTNLESEQFHQVIKPKELAFHVNVPNELLYNSVLSLQHLSCAPVPTGEPTITISDGSETDKPFIVEGETDAK